MNSKPITRRMFVGQSVCAAMALSGLFAARAEARRSSLSAAEFQDAKAFLAEHFVIDLHTHPSLKTSFFGKDLTRAHAAPSGKWPFTMRGDVPSLRDGQVNAIVSNIYAPEAEFLKDCAPLRALSPFLPSLRRVRRSMAQPSEEAVLRELEHFEEVISESEDESSLHVARSVAELDRINAGGGIAVLHAVEGGHSLGGDIGMVDELHRRGVCMLTIAHFYGRGVAPPIMGLPNLPLFRAFNCFQNQVAYEEAGGPLPGFGKEVVERMLSLGMIVDLSHCAPMARREAIAGSRQTACRYVARRAPRPRAFQDESDERRGVAHRGHRRRNRRYFHELLFKREGQGKRNRQHLEDGREADRRGRRGMRGVGIRFRRPCQSAQRLEGASDLPFLAAAMLEGFGADISAKFFGGNARRVLEAGWGRASR